MTRSDDDCPVCRAQLRVDPDVTYAPKPPPEDFSGQTENVKDD